MIRGGTGPIHARGDGLRPRDPDAWLEAATRAQPPPADRDWLPAGVPWKSVRKGHRRHARHRINEPHVARTLYRHAASADASVVVSASMPIRDLEWYAGSSPATRRVGEPRRQRDRRRGLDPALGVAASGTAPRTLALLGDLAFLHDVSGLVNLPDIPCTFVVVDNGGGRTSRSSRRRRRWLPRLSIALGTPPTSDLGAVARVRPPGHGGIEISELEPALASAPYHPALVRVASRRGPRTSPCTTR